MYMVLGPRVLLGNKISVYCKVLTLCKSIVLGVLMMLQRKAKGRKIKVSLQWCGFDLAHGMLLYNACS